MTIDDLKSFMLVCRLHSFSTAAVELSMTQSALSKRLQAIQQEVGSEFISTENRRQILITESGKVFYRYAQRIVSSYDELEQELKAYRELKKRKSANWQRSSYVAIRFDKNHKHFRTKLPAN
ncbi:LysR family transcriptional regulator [Oenococcus oeni]